MVSEEPHYKQIFSPGTYYILMLSIMAKRATKAALLSVIRQSEEEKRSLCLVMAEENGDPWCIKARDEDGAGR